MIQYIRKSGHNNTKGCVFMPDNENENVQDNSSSASDFETGSITVKKTAISFIA